MALHNLMRGLQLNRGLQPLWQNHLLSASCLNANIQSRGVKDQVKERGIIWREPKKLPFDHPKKTCDLKPFDPPDKTRPTIWMRHAMEEYDDSPVIVQQLQSVEFAARNHLLTVAKYDTLRRVQRHQYDSGSLQAQVGKFTCFIRYMQLEENRFYLDNYPHWRVKLKLVIDKRKKYLRYIRRCDYRLFEWLLQELDIVYKPRPLTTGPIYRYDSLRKLVGMHCKNLRTQKLEAYKQSMKERQPAFLKKKVETLQWIKETEEKLGLPVSVDVEKGMIKEKEVLPPTVWDRIFGPFIDNPPLRNFDWQLPEDYVKEYQAICKEKAVQKKSDS